MLTLVTGATGLIGGHVVRELARAGDRVRILVREKSSLEAIADVPVERVAGDIREPASLEAALRGADRVVHAAAMVRTDPFVDERMARTNVEGTRNVLAAARAAGVRRFLYVSSVAAVGLKPDGEPADEETPFNLGDMGPYWVTKREAETLVLAAARAGELDALAVNPSYVFGPGDVKPSSGKLLVVASSGAFVAWPDGGMGVVDARDVARGVLLALEKGRTGERYILSSENLAFRELLGLIARELGVSPPRLRLPRGVARLGAWAGDRLGPLFPATFAYVNTPMVRMFFERAFVSSEKARRELGFSPRPVADTVRDACRWLVETGRIPSRK